MIDETNLAGIPRSVVDAALKDISVQAQALVPSDRAASWYAYGGTVVRFGLAFAAGRGFSWAQGVTGDEATMITWIFVAAVPLAWGLLEKKLAAVRTWWVARTSAAISARATHAAGVPVAVPVEPPPSKI